MARRPADGCADRLARPGPASRGRGDGCADARDRHRGDGGGRHVDERAALSATAGARPGGARRGGAARRAHRGVPARAVVSRVPRLPGAQRRLRGAGGQHPGGGAVVDRRRSGRADLDRIRERQLLRRPAVGCRARPHVPRRRRPPARRCALRRADAPRVADAVRRGRHRPRKGRAPGAGQHDRDRDHAGAVRWRQRPGLRRGVRPCDGGRARRAAMDGASDGSAGGVVLPDRTPAAGRHLRGSRCAARRARRRAGHRAPGCQPPQRALCRVRA